MANPLKGEVSFEVDGKLYTFVFGTYAAAALERRTKMSVRQFFARPDHEFGMDDTLALVHAGLLRHHKMTEEQVADLIDSCGHERFGDIIKEAFELSGMRGQEGNTGGRPPPEAARVNGTGTSS